MYFTCLQWHQFCFLCLLQWREYQTHIGDLESVVKVVLDEYRARVTTSDMTSISSNVYDRTDSAVHRILTAKTLKEWRLISSINDWRTKNSMTHEISSVIVRESLFYLDFITKLQAVLYQEGLELDEIERWKLYYDYQRTSSFCVALHIVTGIFDAFEAEGFKLDITNDTIEEFYNIVPKFNLLLETHELKSVNRSLSLSFSLLSSVLFLLPSNQSGQDSNSEAGDDFTYLKLHIHNKRRNQFDELSESNTEILKMAAVTFCLSFLGLCVVVACSVGFGHLLREESRLAVLVAHWFSHLDSKVDEQKESTHSVLQQVSLIMKLYH